MERSEFEQYIREAVAALPDFAKDALENVAFVIEDEARPVRDLHQERGSPDVVSGLVSNGARRKNARETGIKKNETLLGLYEGIPKTKRGAAYFGVLPDKITIFREPIEEWAGHDQRRVRKLIREVVWHEVGHHLGFDEKGIRALEEKRKR
ncbi:MAG: hypothetical protein G01um101433_696 [Parcubacteria group bacterium Gr01-1014_33]|nr:MAG: hypothetical protein G01um101433_696 [Parcubacteria group bacterium Gr01-1014_33]